MTFRLIFLLIIFAACSNTQTTEGAGAPKPAKKKFETHEQAQQQLAGNKYKAVNLSADQQTAMLAIIKSYPIDQIIAYPNIRKAIRNKIETEVLTPDQNEQWQKSRRAPVVIE